MKLFFKSLNCLKYIKTPDNKIPLFNGGNRERFNELKKFIDDLEKSNESKNKIIGGIQKLKFKSSCIYFDMGEPPKKVVFKKLSIWALSFEYFLDEIKIVTNCGFGANISSKAELLSRLTSAQSTLTLNDTSVTKFERNKLINKVFGNSIKNVFKISELNFPMINHK